MKPKAERLRFLATAVAVLFPGLKPAYSHAADHKPDIVFLVAENAWNSQLTAKDAATPNLEALAKSGATFTNGYAVSSEPGPSNAGLLTGAYPQRFGFDANADGDAVPTDHGKRGLDPAQSTLAQDLKAAGYATGTFGPWHLGTGDGNQPSQHGFDEAHPSTSSLQTAEDAVAFLDHHAADPLFLYVTLAGDKAQIDDAVGKVTAKLQERSLQDSTLIVLVHNEHAAHWSLSENAVRGPFVVTWKGKISAGQVLDQLRSQLDLVPTALAAAGVDARPERNFDGTNLLPLLEGQSKTLPDETLYWRLGPQYAIRRGDWKLVKLTEKGPPELFYLENPSIADVDLFKQQLERDKALQSTWDAWNAGNQPPRWVDSRWNGQGEGASADDSSGPGQTSGPWKSGDSLQGKKAPGIAGKALEISAEIEPTGTDGVIVTQGGAAQGYVIYLTGGKLAFAVREKGDLTTIVADKPVGSGHFAVQASLKQDGSLALSVDGKQVATGKAPGVIAQQPRGGFSVGDTSGGAVGDFESPDPFAGKITNVQVKAVPVQ